MTSYTLDHIRALVVLSETTLSRTKTGYAREDRALHRAFEVDGAVVADLITAGLVECDEDDEGAYCGLTDAGYELMGAH
ncbi:hypothetical protein C8N35_102109 [Breoghania corrubedonensis]|uniref:Uncharacterized protein n=1 Tax=Breoghania corrubedonensis TaxID=665038 RepID=A0A2T5VCB9_9HYPH|nr:hypothetical protein [Breoghania corrubedonensis]PTW61400.1 hypothetical protein C8N35_102109 [Breoghania corrubedonensis]